MSQETSLEGSESVSRVEGVLQERNLGGRIQPWDCHSTLITPMLSLCPKPLSDCVSTQNSKAVLSTCSEMNSSRPEFLKSSCKEWFHSNAHLRLLKIALELQFHLPHSKKFENWLPTILVLPHINSQKPCYGANLKANWLASTPHPTPPPEWCHWEASLTSPMPPTSHSCHPYSTPPPFPSPYLGAWDKAGQNWPVEDQFWTR